jgi:hypothetical protein
MRKTQKAKLRCTREDKNMLFSLSKSKTAPHREVIRAGILPKYMEGLSITDIA